MTNSIIVSNSNIRAVTIDSEQSQYAEGELVKAEVVGKNHRQTTIELYGKKINISSDVEIQESIGEKAIFKIEKADNKKLVLKYQPKSHEEVNASGTLKSGIRTTENLQTDKIKDQIQSIDVSMDNKFLGLAEELKGQIEEIVDIATEDDIKAIIKDNYSIDKITVEMFKELVKQNKIALKMGDTATVTKAIEQNVGEFSEAFTEKFGSTDNLKQIIETLKQQQLPISLKHIEKVQQVLKQYQQLNDLSEGQILNMLKNRNTFTISEAAKTILLPNQVVHVSTDIQTLEPQISKLLENNGVETSEVNVRIMMKAIAAGVALDQVSLDKIHLLTTGIKEDTNESQWQDTAKILGERAVTNLQEKIAVGQIELPIAKVQLSESTNQYENILDQLYGITDDQIFSVIDKGEITNIDNFVKADSTIDIITQKIRFSSISETVSRVVGSHNIFELNQAVEMTQEQLHINAKAMVDESGELQFIKAKICIEEMRLKMTYESARQLSSKGIDVAIEPVENVVKALKAMENEQYKSALRVHNVAESDENLGKMEATMTSVTRLSTVSSRVMVRVMNHETKFTLEAITEEQSIAITTSRALSSYDEMGTEVRPDLGDKLENTFTQIKGILEDLGLKASEENTRLVKALARSESEMTVENIEDLKVVDRKVNLLTETIRPTMVAKMIQDNINPMSLNMDEMLEYVRGYEDAFMNTEEEVLAEAILDLKESGNLSSDEKESLIGIYRMLQTIGRSKGAAASFLVKNQMELNMKNLFETAKYISKNGMKRQTVLADIDDDFGILERLDMSKQTVSDQIKSAISEGVVPTKTNIDLLEHLEAEGVALSKENVSQVTNHHLLIEQFFNGFSQEKMKILNDTGMLSDYEQSMESIVEALNTMEDEPGLQAKNILGQMTELVKLDIQSLKEFEAYGFKGTANQLATHLLFKDDANMISQRFNELMNLSEGNQTAYERLQMQIGRLSEEGIQDKYLEILEDIKSEMDSLRLGFSQDSSQDGQLERGFRDASQLIDYQQQIFENEEYYQIPMWMDGAWSQLNVYYQNHSAGVETNENDEMDIYLFFDTKNMGKVQSHMHLKEKQMQFTIYGEMDEDKALLQSYQSKIMEVIGSESYSVESISYEFFDAESPIDEGLNHEEDSLRYLDSKFAARA